MTEPRQIAFEGTFEEVQEHFHSLGWTDGLPVVPPTEAAVARFLRFTDLDPEHVVVARDDGNLAASLPGSSRPPDGRSRVRMIGVAVTARCWRSHANCAVRRLR